jgi:hypothetical protein
VGLWTVFNALFGLILLGQGAFKRRPTAVRCGAALLGFVLLDVVLVSVALRRGGDIPAIGVHAVVLLPVSIWLAWKGATALSGR